MIGEDFDIGDAAERGRYASGYIVTLVGRVPVRGELVRGLLRVPFEIEILDADPRRVKRVRIYPRKQTPRAAERTPARRPDAASRAGAPPTSPVAEKSDLPPAYPPHAGDEREGAAERDEPTAGEISKS